MQQPRLSPASRASLCAVRPMMVAQAFCHAPKVRVSRRRPCLELVALPDQCTSCAMSAMCGTTRQARRLSDA